MMAPYPSFHVYEISGAISDSRDFFKEDLIGCWNEGDMTYLFFFQAHDKEVEALVRKKGLSLLSKDILDYKTMQGEEELKPFKVGDLVFCPP